MGEQTGRRHGGQLLSTHRPALIAGFIGGQPTVKMIGAATRPDSIARMLDPAIAVEKPCPYNADARAQQVGDHLIQPLRVNHLGVVVEQADKLARGLTHARIVDR